MLQSSGLNISLLRQEALVEEFNQAVGNRILVLTESYPFFFVGEIVEVRADTVYILVDLSNIPEFDNVNLRTQINNIQVYFIETPDNPIPEIRL
ncbi:hypothetical protein ACFSVM_08845 [Paenibacillus shunpengii]|uniref:Uncharacterized protein n=1 Tax=Paenibacillus shunpengii TaxID=2054424 RepID=A0ABW5SNB8_9BACL